MKNIPFIEFKEIFDRLKQYDDEISSINSALKPFLNGGNLEIGYFLMDGYMELAAKYLDVDAEHISWYVFDNSWGCARKTLFRKKIKTLKNFYDVLLKNT